MGAVEKLEAQVAALPEADLRSFRNWFAEFDAERWDNQIAADAAAGKLEGLADEALKQFGNGQCKRL